ncbi:MAG: hypothetical protein QM498_08500 [Desulfobacterium sp.]
MVIILDLFDTISGYQISETVGKIRKPLPDLLNYFDQAATTIQNLEQSVFDKEALKALRLAWQWHKNLMKSKKAPRRHYCRGGVKRLQNTKCGLFQNRVTLFDKF